MDAITTIRTEATQATLSPALFNSFLEWIDRSETTTRNYACNLRQFVAWLRYAGVAQPARRDVISYRDWLGVEHDAIQIDRDSMTGWAYRTNRNGEPLKVMCKPSTVQLYLRSVCQFFRWTSANGLYPDIAQNVHAPKVDRSTHKKDALTAREVQEIETHITQEAQEVTQRAAEAEKDTAGRIQRSTEQGKRLYAMYLLTTTAGLRTIELHRANVKDIETKGGQTWLYIWGKGHTEPDQKKPIAAEVAAAIRDYMQSRTDHPTGNSPLFVSTGNRSGGRRIATTTISKMLKGAMRSAGYDSERLTAHSLRHTTGTAIQELTGNIYTTQQYMRHTDPKTTEIYLHNDTEQQEAGLAQQLYNLFHGITDTDSRAKLQTLLDRMNAQQIEQLTTIAAAMA